MIYIYYCFEEDH